MRTIPLGTDDSLPPRARYPGGPRQYGLEEGRWLLTVARLAVPGHRHRTQGGGALRETYRIYATPSWAWDQAAELGAGAASASWIG